MKNTIRRDKASGSATAEMLELSEWKLKITVIHMPRALVEKSGQQVKTDGKINVSRDVNPKKESTGNARNQQYRKRNEDAFDGLIRGLDMDHEIISKPEDILTETSQTDKQRTKRKNNIPETRTMGQLQKCDIHVMGNQKKSESMK